MRGNKFYGTSKSAAGSCSFQVKTLYTDKVKNGVQLSAGLSKKNRKGE